MPTVFLIGQYWVLRTAVRAELRELGLEALGFATLHDAVDALRSGPPPEAVVLDATSADPPLSGSLDELDLIRVKSQMILIASALEKLPEQVASPEKAQRFGVVVLKKPLRVAEVLDAVRRLLEGHPA